MISTLVIVVDIGRKKSHERPIDEFTAERRVGISLLSFIGFDIMRQKNSVESTSLKINHRSNRALFFWNFPSIQRVISCHFNKAFVLVFSRFLLSAYAKKCSGNLTHLLSSLVKFS